MGKSDPLDRVPHGRSVAFGRTRVRHVPARAGHRPVDYDLSNYSLLIDYRAIACQGALGTAPHTITNFEKPANYSFVVFVWRFYGSVRQVELSRSES